MFVNKYILKRRFHFDFKSNFQQKMFDKMFFTLDSLIINFFNIFFYIQTIYSKLICSGEEEPVNSNTLEYKCRQVNSSRLRTKSPDESLSTE